MILSLQVHSLIPNVYHKVSLHTPQKPEELQVERPEGVSR